MKRYIDKIFNEGCLDILSKMLNDLGESSIDMCLTDPPYNISSEMESGQAKKDFRFKTRADIIVNYGEWDQYESIEEFWEFTKSWVYYVSLLLKPGAVLFSFFDRDKINILGRICEKQGLKLKDYFCWFKSNPVPQVRKTKWMTGFELAGIWQKQGSSSFRKDLPQLPDYIKAPIVHHTTRLHPTQKPEPVIERALLYWTQENDIILDPFAGSGTTGAVCKKNSRHYILIEQDSDYCEKALRRLKGIRGSQLILPLEVEAA